MSLKSFIIASLIIHVVGGIALYFYYNPIKLSPKPVEMVEGLKEPAEKAQEEKPLTKQSFLRKRKKQTESAPPPGPLAPVKAEPTLLPEAPAKVGPPPKKFQVEAIKAFREEESPVELTIEEIKENDPVSSSAPPAQSDSASISENLENFEVMEDDFLQPLEEDPLNAPAKDQPAKPSETSIKADLQKLAPSTAGENSQENVEDYEELLTFPEDSPKPKTDTIKQAKAPLTKTQKPALPPGNIEDYEELEEEPPAPFAQNTPEPQEEPPTPSAQNTPKTPAEQENIKQNSPPTKASPPDRQFYSLKQEEGNPDISSYPDFARRGKMQGTVVVRFFVTKAGFVDKIQLLDRTGHSELDNFVIRSLANYKFLPDQEGWVSHTINYKLSGEELELLRLRQEE